MLTETNDYEKLCREFRWEIPARFNMATACCDRHADGSGRLALIYVDEDGSSRHRSFDELAEMSRRFANVLKADGLQRGDRVALFLSQSLELPLAHLSAFRAGMISIPLFALFGEDALEFRLANSGAKTIVTDAIGWEKLKRIRDKLPDLKNIYLVDEDAPAGTRSFWPALQAASPEFATVDTVADDPAMIIYTSGTTGNPKGALHAHRVLLGHLPNVEMIHDFFPKADDVMWTPADWAWIGALFDVLFPALYHGVPVVGHRARKFDPHAAMQLMADHKIRNVFLPPTALKLMRQAEVRNPNVKLRSIFSGGEALGAELLDWVRTTFGIEVHEGVYAAFSGPSYETPAEIHYLRTIGADLVGMSTAPEVIAARHMGIRVLGISCVTNMASGILDRPLDHAEVLATGERVKGQFVALLRAVLPRIAAEKN